MHILTRRFAVQEPFKHVSIFAMFVVAVLLFNALRIELRPHFRFDFGDAVLMVLWATGVVALFQLLYHYFGQQSDKITYLCTIASIVLTGFLVHYDMIPLQMH